MSFLPQQDGSFESFLQMLYCARSAELGLPSEFDLLSAEALSADSADPVLRGFPSLRFGEAVVRVLMWARRHRADHLEKRLDLLEEVERRAANESIFRLILELEQDAWERSYGRGVQEVRFASVAR